MAATATERVPTPSFGALAGARGQVGLLAVLLAYVLLALAYAHYVPAWQSPDEPAHFNYIRYVADRGQLPVLEPGDYPGNVVPVGPKFPPSSDISAFRYESHQPPLYYVMAALFYKLGARILAIRCLSIFFGAALLVVIWACARVVLPAWPASWPATAAFAAFIPMHVFMTASIDNDTLAELILSLLLLLYLALATNQQVAWRWQLLGLLLGAALLTKVTIYLPAALLAAGCLAIGWWRGERGARPAFTAGVVAVIVAGWWFVRNGLIYGWNDVAALTRQEQVNGAQVHTGTFDWMALSRFVVGSFHSFWAQFGWMSIPISDATYAKLGVLSALIIFGLAVLAVRAWAARLWGMPLPIPFTLSPSSALWAVGGLFVTWAAVLGGDLDYNLRFVQLQGRYLFPALAAIAMAAVCGTAGLFPRKLQASALTLLSLGLFLFSVYSLHHDLIPAFSG